MREADVVKDFFAVIRKLNQEGTFKIKAVKTHGGAFTSGEPDVIGCWTQGDRTTAFALEFKAPGAKKMASERQLHTLLQWEMAGAKTGVPTSVAAALKIIGLAGPLGTYVDEVKEEAYNERHRRIQPKRDRHPVGSFDPDSTEEQAGS